MDNTEAVQMAQKSLQGSRNRIKNLYVSTAYEWILEYVTPTGRVKYKALGQADTDYMPYEAVRRYFAGLEELERTRLGIRSLQVKYHPERKYVLYITDAAIASRQWETPGWELPKRYREIFRSGHAGEYVTDELLRYQKYLFWAPSEVQS